MYPFLGTNNKLIPPEQSVALNTIPTPRPCHWPQCLPQEGVTGQPLLCTLQSTTQGGYTQLFANFCSFNFKHGNHWKLPLQTMARRYNFHICVEVAATLACVVYLFKYVYKGPDRAQATVGEDSEPMSWVQDNAACIIVYFNILFLTSSTHHPDEITSYLDGRYVSTSEASWRLFGFPLHEMRPFVIPLAVHTGCRSISFGF